LYSKVDNGSKSEKRMSNDNDKCIELIYYKIVNYVRFIFSPWFTIKDNYEKLK